MAEGGDDGKRRCVLDVVGAQGLQSYLKGALGAARAEAGRARVRRYVLPRLDELECANMSRTSSSAPICRRPTDEALHSMNKHEALHPMNKSLDEVLQTRPFMEALRHAGLCRLLAGAQRNILAHSRQKGQNNSWLPPPPLHP